MNWMAELKRALKKYWWVLLIFLVGIPLGIHTLYKFYLGIPFLVGAFDAGDLLGFYGAVLGGFVTLLVLLITTDETRKIQRKNEEQLEVDRAEKRINDRRLFMNSVIEDVSKLLANMARCKDSGLKILKCEKRIEEFERELAIVRINLAQSKKMVNAPFVENNLHIQEMQEKELIQALQVERDNVKTYYVTKEPALERAFVLNIKLAGIKEAEILLEKIKHIMELEENDSVTFEDFVEEMNKTMQITADFADAYING